MPDRELNQLAELPSPSAADLLYAGRGLDLDYKLPLGDLQDFLFGAPANGQTMFFNNGVWAPRSLNGAPIQGVVGNGATYYQNGALRFLSTAGRGEGDYLGIVGGAMAFQEHPAHILHGAGAPTSGQGQIDDYYLRTTDPPRWYQKTSNVTWALQFTWPASGGGQTAQEVLDLIAGAVPFWARINHLDQSLADIPVDNMSPNVAAAIDAALGSNTWRTGGTATLNIGGLISAIPTLQDRFAFADESDGQSVRQGVLSQMRSLYVPEWGDGVNTYVGRTHVRLRGHVWLEQDPQRVYLNFPDRGIAAEIDTGNSPDGKIWAAEDLRYAAETWGAGLAFVSSDASLEGAGTPADTIGIAPAILAGISDLGSDLATAQIKLAGIEAGATADQTDAEHVAAIDAALGSTAWQGGGGGGDAFSWASVGNTDRIPDAKIPIGVTRDQELLTALALSLADIGLTLNGTMLGIVTDGSGAAMQDLPAGGGGLTEAQIEQLIGEHIISLGPTQPFPLANEAYYDEGTMLSQGPHTFYVAQHGAPPADAVWTWADLTTAYLAQYRGVVDGGNPTVANPQTGDWVYHKTNRRWLRWVGSVFAFSSAPPGFDAQQSSESYAEHAGVVTVGVFIYDTISQEVRVITAYAGGVPDTRTYEWASQSSSGASLSREALYPFLYDQILAGDFIVRSVNFPARTITYGVNMPIGGLADVPSLGSAAQVLAVNAGGTATEWVNQTGGGGLDAFDWATEGNTDRIPTSKMAADAVVGGLQVTSNTLIIDFAEGISQTLNLPNALTGGSLTLTGQQLELYVTRHTGGVLSLGSVTLPAGGGGGDDAYDWATEGNTARIPRAKMFGNTVVGISRGGGQLVFELAGGLLSTVR